MESPTCITSLGNAFQQLDKYYTNPKKFLFFSSTTILGKGATASVRTVIKKSEKKEKTSRLYAVKFRRPGFQRQRLGNWRLREQESFFIAQTLRHPHIVEMVDLCAYGHSVAIVMEHCQSDLCQLLAMRYLTTKDKLCIFKQLLLGVAFMHDNGVAHMDIKLENILVDASGIVKLCDLDCAEVVDGGNSRLEQYFQIYEEQRPPHCSRGTPCYWPPEIFEAGEGLDLRKFDVWSCAITWVALMTAELPWDEACVTKNEYRIFDAAWTTWLDENVKRVPDDLDYPELGRPFKSSFAGPNAARCILRMLHPNPDLRCTISTALNDSFIQRIECCSPLTKWVKFRTGSRGNQLLQKEIVHNHMPPKKPIHERILPKCLQYSFDLGHYSLVD